MGKPIFPKDLLSKELSGKNKEWVEEYKSHTNYGRGYHQKIENFFKFNPFYEKPFNTFKTSDLERYIEIMLDSGFSSDTINALVSALSGFRNYLLEKYKEEFPDNFLVNLSKLRFDDAPPSDAEPLKLIQLSFIREYNKNNLNDEYIFEMYFQLGIMKKDIIRCYPSNANFLFKNKSLTYNPKIVDLLERTKNIKELKLEIGTVNSYLVRVTTYLREQNVYHKERLLNYSDIHESYKVYIFKCPNCGLAFENVSKNWVLSRVEFDDEYRLFCVQCKGVSNGN